MLIANPIYDVVFKYLFEDKSIAMKFLSLILEKEIIKLDFRPTELNTKIEANKSFLTIYRIDFSAKIRNSDASEELVIIEIQKAKFHTDIMRFRRYLGSQYMSDNNQYKPDEITSRALPIISIYFLGHKLTHATAPVIKVLRTYHDISQKDDNIISEKEEFIESLTHDSYIIQIPYLRQRRQTALLQVLSVFDQGNIDSNNHILNVKEKDLPKEYWPIIRRLQKAVANKKISAQMTAEDDILSELQNKDRVIHKKDEKIIQMQEQLSMKDEKLTIQQKQLSQKEKALQIALDLLISQGMTEEEARKKLNL